MADSKLKFSHLPNASIFQEPEFSFPFHSSKNGFEESYSQDRNDERGVRLLTFGPLWRFL